MTTYEPTEYDQHVRYADNETDRARSQLGDDGPANGIIFATLAVAEATLAAAEQARIANLIAIAQFNTNELNWGAEHGITATVDQMTRLHELQGVIREALGLPDPEAETADPASSRVPTAGEVWAEQRRMEIERLRLGDVHEFDNPDDLAYRMRFLEEVRQDPRELAGAVDRASAELAEYRRIAPEKAGE